MAKAVKSKAEGGGRTRRRPKAQEDARIFSIYVNPNASEAVDPEGLQSAAFQTLLEWQEDNSIKENILRAVLFYIDRGVYKEKPDSINEKLEQFYQRIDQRLQKITIQATGHAMPEEDAREISDDLFAFAEEYLSFSD